MKQIKRVKLGKQDFETIIASMPHHDSLVFELWANDKHLAEIFFEEGEHKIEVFSNSQPTESWIARVDDLIELLRRAKREIRSPTNGIGDPE